MTAKRKIVAMLSSAVLIWSIWSPSQLQAGQTQDDEIKNLYALNCVACHASDGSGDTAVGKQLKASDLRSEKVQKESDRELYDFIAKGKKKMPGFEKKLDKDQISRLVTYLRMLAKGR
jgi:mono/diheme cytochrome c family protein